MALYRARINRRSWLDVYIELTFEIAKQSMSHYSDMKGPSPHFLVSSSTTGWTDSIASSQRANTSTGSVKSVLDIEAICREESETEYAIIRRRYHTGGFDLVSLSTRRTA